MNVTTGRTLFDTDTLSFKGKEKNKHITETWEANFKNNNWFELRSCQYMCWSLYFSLLYSDSICTPYYTTYGARVHWCTVSHCLHWQVCALGFPVNSGSLAGVRGGWRAQVLTKQPIPMPFKSHKTRAESTSNWKKNKLVRMIWRLNEISKSRGWIIIVI